MTKTIFHRGISKHSYLKSPPACLGLVLVSLLLISTSAPQASTAKPRVVVKISGVKGQARENVLRLLEIYREKDKAELTLGRLRFLHEKACRDIKKALEPFGYFKCSVESSLIPPGNGQDTWQATYKIDPGPKIRIGRINFLIQGPGKKLKTFSIKPPFETGQELNQETYEKFKDDLLLLAKRHGFNSAKFLKHQIIIDLERYQADIDLVFDTGPQYFFGAVIFKGSTLSPDFLKGYTNIQKGDAFDQNRLVKIKARLLDSGYFKTVDIEPQWTKASPDKYIPVEVVVSMNKPNVYRAGVGYGSDTGPRITLDWKRRYIGRFGHHGEVKLLYSPKDSYLEGEYIIPLKRPESEYLSLKPGIERYDTKSRDGWHYTTSFTYSVITEGGWRRNLGFNLGYETYNVGDDSSSSGEFIPSISWYKTVADNVIYTTKGYMVRFGTTGALKGLLADESYVRPRFSLKWIRAFENVYRFISRMDLGATLAKDLRDLPASARFFTGGQASIRGFSLDELGPEDSKTGDVLGGRYLAVGSVELERQIHGKWLGALFCDIGNSFDPDLKNRVEVGTGFGIRWRSPLGLVRLDFGFGVSRSSMPFKFYISVGPDF